MKQSYSLEFAKRRKKYAYIIFFEDSFFLRILNECRCLCVEKKISFHSEIEYNELVGRTMMCYCISHWRRMYTWASNETFSHCLIESSVSAIRIAHHCLSVTDKLIFSLFYHINIITCMVWCVWCVSCAFITFDTKTIYGRYYS